MTNTKNMTKYDKYDRVAALKNELKSNTTELLRKQDAPFIRSICSSTKVEAPSLASKSP